MPERAVREREQRANRELTKTGIVLGLVFGAVKWIAGVIAGVEGLRGQGSLYSDSRNYSVRLSYLACSVSWAQRISL